MKPFPFLPNKKLNLYVHKTSIMSAIEINSKTVPAITYVKKMRDYSKDPFFIKKKQDATEFIKKTGLPNSVKSKSNSVLQSHKQKSRIA